MSEMPSSRAEMTLISDYAANRSLYYAEDMGANLSAPWGLASHQSLPNSRRCRDSETPREVEHPPWYVKPDVCRVGFYVLKSERRTKSGILAVVGPQEATTT